MQLNNLSASFFFFFSLFWQIEQNWLLKANFYVTFSLLLMIVPKKFIPSFFITRNLCPFNIKSKLFYPIHIGSVRTKPSQRQKTTYFAWWLILFLYVLIIFSHSDLAFNTTSSSQSSFSSSITHFSAHTYHLSPLYFTNFSNVTFINYGLLLNVCGSTAKPAPAASDLKYQNSRLICTFTDCFFPYRSFLLCKVMICHASILLCILICLLRICLSVVDIER